jgi:hypothetical protein
MAAIVYYLQVILTITALPFEIQNLLVDFIVVIHVGNIPGFGLKKVNITEDTL